MIGLQRILRFLCVLAIFFVMSGCSKKVEDKEQVHPGEKIVLKFSHVVAEYTPKGLAARKFAALVEKRTQGRVEIQVFPNSTLYADGEETQALRSGAVHFIAPSTSKLSDLYPRWQIFDMPYLFKDTNDIHSAMKGSIGQTLFGDLEKGGIYPLAFWDNDFKQITNRLRPLKNPGDLNGLKFRTMIYSTILEEQFRLLGAIPVQLKFNEVYSALSSQKIDGQENTMSNILTQRFHEVQPYLTVSNHGFLGYVVMTDKSLWMKLPPDIRAIIEESMNEVTEWEREQARIINESDMATIKASGKVTIHIQSPEEKAEWEKVLYGLEKKLNDIVGPQLSNEIKYRSR